MRNRTLAELLAEPGRTWVGVPGASPEAIRSLVQDCPWVIPDVLLDLLSLSNGGEGDVPLLPRCFVLDSAEEIRSSLTDAHLLEQFPGFLFIGGNGGLERIALDCRSDEPYAVVAIDPIAGPGSAEQIARDADEFVGVLGLASSDRRVDDA